MSHKPTGTIFTQSVEREVARRLAAQNPQMPAETAQAKGASVGVGMVLLAFAFLCVLGAAGLVALPFLVTRTAPDKWFVGFAVVLLTVGFYLAIKGANGASGEGLDAATEMHGVTGALARLIRGKKNGAT